MNAEVCVLAVIRLPFISSCPFPSSLISSPHSFRLSHSIGATVFLSPSLGHLLQRGACKFVTLLSPPPPPPPLFPFWVVLFFFVLFFVGVKAAIPWERLRGGGVGG
eukprot:RCo017096